MVVLCLIGLLVDLDSQLLDGLCVKSPCSLCTREHDESSLHVHEMCLPCQHVLHI